MNVSIPRLRAFVDKSEAAHAALISANERVRAARRTIQDARTQMRIHTDSLHANTGGGDSIARQSAVLQRQLDTANAALTAAEVAQSSAHEIWAHASALASSGRAYADQLGVLPDDMKTED